MKNFQKIIALAGVGFLLLLVVATLYFAFTGSRYFLPSLVVMLVFPTLLYGYMIVYRALGGNNKKKEEKER